MDETTAGVAPKQGRAASVAAKAKRPLLLRIDEIKMSIKSTQTGLEMHRYISILSISAKSIFQKQYWNWSNIMSALM